MSQAVKLDIDAGIATIILSRPDAMNCYNEDMAHQLLRVFEQVDVNDNVRVVLLKGEGRSFCAGGDIDYFAEKLDNMPGNIPDIIEILNTTITTMLSLSKPIFAVAHGSVAGVGMSFIMACDLVLATTETKFNMAYAGIGLTPDGGASYLLPRIVGHKRAMQMFMLPEIFSAQQAVELGLINWAIEPSRLHVKQDEIIKQLSTGPTKVFKRVKRLLDQTWRNELDDQLLAEMYAFTESCVNQDFKRGVKAFLDKQKPKFEGN